jgi:hypothetical protein
VVILRLHLLLRLGPFLTHRSTLSIHSTGQVVLCFVVRATLM